jgi:hypothetical protein
MNFCSEINCVVKQKSAAQIYGRLLTPSHPSASSSTTPLFANLVRQRRSCPWTPTSIARAPRSARNHRLSRTCTVSRFGKRDRPFSNALKGAASSRGAGSASVCRGWESGKERGASGWERDNEKREEQQERIPDGVECLEGGHEERSGSNMRV